MAASNSPLGETTPWAMTLAHYFSFINSAGNPVIYCITDTSYRRFVRTLFMECRVEQPRRASSRSSAAHMRMMSFQKASQYYTASSPNTAQVGSRYYTAQMEDSVMESPLARDKGRPADLGTTQEQGNELGSSSEDEMFGPEDPVRWVAGGDGDEDSIIKFLRKVKSAK